MREQRVGPEETRRQQHQKVGSHQQPAEAERDLPPRHCHTTLKRAIIAVGSAFGLVGTVLVLTIWVYATCLVLFLGAEFCKVWAQRK